MLCFVRVLLLRASLWRDSKDNQQTNKQNDHQELTDQHHCMHACMYKYTTTVVEWYSYTIKLAAFSIFLRTSAGVLSSSVAIVFCVSTGSLPNWLHKSPSMIFLTGMYVDL